MAKGNLPDNFDFELINGGRPGNDTSAAQMHDFVSTVLHVTFHFIMWPSVFFSSRMQASLMVLQEGLKH